MESLSHYRDIISKLLQAGAGPYAMPSLEDVFIRSEDGNRFLLIRTGWFKGKDYYALIQDVLLGADGMVIIYADNTEDDLAEELIDAGISADKIIKAYDPNQSERLNQRIQKETQYRQAA